MKDGLIRTGRLPRSRFFVWIDPQAPARSRRVHRRSTAVEGSIRLLPPAHRVRQDDRSRARLHVRGDGNRDGPRSRITRLRRRHRRGNLERVQATGTPDPRRRPYRRSERNPSGGGRRERAARRMSAGRDAAHLRPAPVPESVAGGLEGVHNDGEDRD